MECPLICPKSIDTFAKSLLTILGTHSLGTPGAYRRWNSQHGDSVRDLSMNPYGCADAANILYTIGYFPSDSQEREGWVVSLQGLQNAETGLFSECPHSQIHTTAHCIAALELFDAKPLHPLHELQKYKDPKEMLQLLEDLDWKIDPWGASHNGAGIYAALVLAEEVSVEWQNSYFAWLSENFDPASGLLRKGFVEDIDMGWIHSRFPHLASTFHYLFNMEYAHQPLPYASAMVDSCLNMLNEDPFPLGQGVTFADIDWVFCLTRSLRQSGHRHEECKETLATYAEGYVNNLLNLDPETDDGLNDLHSLFGALCCLAELQDALPGQLPTEKPLKLVLDRRPYI